MSEITFSGTEHLPSAYISSEQLADRLSVDAQVLPWLRQGETYDFAVARCTLVSGETFLVASALGSDRRLVWAAKGMTDHQRRITDNMFYSRIAGYVSSGHSISVDTMRLPVTPFPIHVMRNQGGQRIYFGQPRISQGAGTEAQQVVLRLGVCDKNRQRDVLKVLSSASDGENRSRKI